MATDRKTKIETLQKIASGIDPRPPDIHVLLNKLSVNELNALLELKRQPLEKIKQMLQERNIYTNEEIIAFLSTDEFR
jgi:hypothetical protein